MLRAMHRKHIVLISIFYFAATVTLCVLFYGSFSNDIQCTSSSFKELQQENRDENGPGASNHGIKHDRVMNDASNEDEDLMENLDSDIEDDSDEKEDIQKVQGKQDLTMEEEEHQRRIAAEAMVRRLRDMDQSPWNVYRRNDNSNTNANDQMCDENRGDDDETEIECPNLNLRGAYHFNGFLVLLVEAAVSSVKSKDYFTCWNGKRPLMEPIRQQNWVFGKFPHLTHAPYFFKCAMLPSNQSNCGHIMPKYATLGAGKCTAKVRFGATPLDLLDEPKYNLCTMTGTLYGNLPLLERWLNHQIHIKSEHIIAYVVDPLPFSPRFAELVEKGYVTVVSWVPKFKKNVEIYGMSQHLAYVDYVYRFRGLCSWTSFADVDDFYVDWTTNHDMSKLLAQHEAKSKATCIQLYWPQFHPDCGFNSSLPFLKSFLYGRRRGNTKHITKTVKRGDIGIHRSYGTTCILKKLPSQMYHVRYFSNMTCTPLPGRNSYNHKLY